MKLAHSLNTLWMWKCVREKSAFDRSLQNVASTQASVLGEIIGRNAKSMYGRRYRFDQIKTPADFQQQVPVTEYEDYASYVERISNGERGVLTSGDVRMLEPTSGTTSAEKLIPYTDALKRQFQIAVEVWIADLFRHRPDVRRGRAYWSISPALNQRRQSPGGIPIGFDDDVEYLSGIQKRLARSLLAVPQTVAGITDIDPFRYITLLHLVLSRDLSLISVWSPTYLSVLMRCLENWSDRICSDIRNRRFSDAADLRIAAAATSSHLPRWPDRRGAEEIESILLDESPLPERLRQLWPNLALISCWTDAGAAPYVSDIRRLFPGVEIQPKGLLATEGFISIPLTDQPGASLAVRSHFFEFLEHDETGSRTDDFHRCLLAHELQSGNRYRVLLTTGGGLYRYQMHDVIEVVGWKKQCPLLRFVGKANLVSDTVGEKLSEPHVREALTTSLANHHLRTQFCILVPVTSPTPRYRLYLQVDQIDKATTSSLRTSLERHLKKNVYYRHAIEMQQLAPLEIAVLDSGGESAANVFQRICVGRGQKIGDIKFNALDMGDEWPNAFQRHVLFTCST